MKTLSLTVTMLLLMALVSGCGDDATGHEKGWAVGANVDGYGAIIHTDDGGASWVRQGDNTTIPDVAINDVSAVDGQYVWSVGESAPDANGTSFGTILYSENGGIDWVRQGTSATIPDTGFAGISAVSSEVAWAVGSGGEIMYTDDGGGHWSRQDEGAFTNVFFQMVSAVNTQNVWAAGGFGSGGAGAFIARTTDGEHWEQVDLNIFGDVEGFIDIHAVNEKVVWAVGTGGTVAVTRNGGETWVRTGPGGLLHVNGVCALDDRRAWIAVDSYTLYYTSDGGFTWTQQDRPDPDSIPALSGAYMGVTAVDSRHAWLVGLNSPQMQDKPIIKYTGDGGKTWTAQTSAANTQLRRVSFVGDVRP